MSGYRVPPRIDEGESLVAYKTRVAGILAAGRNGELYAAMADDVERLIRMEIARFMDPASEPDVVARAHIRASAYEHLLRQWDAGASALEMAEQQFQNAQDKQIARQRGLDRDDAGFRAAGVAAPRRL